jgi:hypothetical protein
MGRRRIWDFVFRSPSSFTFYTTGEFACLDKIRSNFLLGTLSGCFFFSLSFLVFFSGSGYILWGSVFFFFFLVFVEVKWGVSFVHSFLFILTSCCIYLLRWSFVAIIGSASWKIELGICGRGRGCFFFFHVHSRVSGHKNHNYVFLRAGDGFAGRGLVFRDPFAFFQGASLFGATAGWFGSGRPLNGVFYSPPF